MFEQVPESTAWYHSWPVVLAATVVFPPLGLVLLWTRRGTDMQLKVLGSLAVVLLCAGYAYALLGPRRSANTEGHYTELERHREAQRQQPPPPEVAQATATAADPNAAAQASPGADAAAGQPPQPAAPGTEAAAASAPGQPAAPSSAAPPARRNYWTNFRGPSRDGRYEEQTLKTNWGAGGPAKLWSQPVGGGYASFSVADGIAYTIEQRRGQETVAAYHVDTGRELWTHGWNAEYRDSTGDGPRATPTWDAGRVYALGALGELRCLDAKTGKPVWSKNILSDNGASNIQWAMAASPLIVDDKVVVMAGGRAGKSVVAYNKATGARAWGALGDEASYTSPMLVNLAGRRQILVVTANQAAGIAPEDGAVLWSYPWRNSAGINISQPIVAGPNRVFISAGYGKGAALFEVASSGKAFNATTVWENVSMKNKFNSSVLHDGHVYGLDEGILSCVDVNTGERKWKGGRYGYGQVVLAGGHLIITTEEGEVVLVRAAADKHTELARFKALDGKTWNNPAIAGGRLLVRNAEQMACFKLTD
ncbi:MAG TPA: PQQ-binding-like beta-propeller repeat protein [Pyrinomonadaceae bacterium]